MTHPSDRKEKTKALRFLLTHPPKIKWPEVWKLRRKLGMEPSAPQKYCHPFDHSPQWVGNGYACGVCMIRFTPEPADIIPGKVRHSKLNRIEVIDWTSGSRFGGGRVFVAWKEDIQVETDLQDNDKTLKVFIKDV